MARLSNAFIGLGIVEGVSELSKFNEGRDSREANRANARNQRDLSQERLDEFRRNQPVREAESTSQELQFQQLIAADAERRTFKAFDLYTSDGNTEHLNNMLKALEKHPAGNVNAPDVLRFDKLVRSPESDQLLLSSGITDVEGFYNDPKLIRSFPKLTMKDGTVKLCNTSQMFIGSGYHEFVGDRERENILVQSQIDKNMMGGIPRALSGSADERSAARKVRIRRLNPEPGDENLSDDQLLDQFMTELGETTENLTQMEKRAEDIAARTGRDISEVMEELVGKSKLTSKQKNLNDAEQQLVDIDTLLGDDSFFDTDFSERSNRQKRLSDGKTIASKIERFEKLSGSELSNPEKKELSFVNELLAVGNIAGEITDKETGILDNLLFNVKKSVFDDIEGVEQAAAYAAFRNTLRHALYGSALTPTEVQSFNEAFGNLKQQRGPVLEQLKVSLTQVKAKLDTLAQVGNDHVVHFRFGADRERLDDAIDQIDSRINELFGAEPTLGEVTELTLGTTQTKTSLDDIFGNL